MQNISYYLYETPERQILSVGENEKCSVRSTPLFRTHGNGRWRGDHQIVTSLVALYYDVGGVGAGVRSTLCCSSGAFWFSAVEW